MAGGEKEGFLELLEVAEGIGESVRVIDAEGGDASFADPADNQAMDVVEDGRVFDANADELCNIKESAVVDFLRGDAPEGEAVGLLFEELVEGLEACRVFNAAPEGRDAAVYRRPDAGADLEQAT